MNKKYKILKKKFIDFEGTRLYRIQRISDGLIGGYVESENNLSQTGNCFIYENAKVSGDTTVFGNAEVSGDAEVFGDAKIYGDAIIKNIKIEKTEDYIIFGPIGSRHSFITICKKQDYIATGCFHGTKKEFLKQVKATHKDNIHAQNYKKLIKFIF